MRPTTTMNFVCTPLKESPPAILATCCLGKRLLSHKHTHTHTHCTSRTKSALRLLADIKTEALWTLSLQTTVRIPLKDLGSSCSSPVYPNNLFVTLPLPLFFSAHVPWLHKVPFEFTEWYRHPKDRGSWSLSQWERLSGLTFHRR